PLHLAVLYPSLLHIERQGVGVCSRLVGSLGRLQAQIDRGGGPLFRLYAVSTMAVSKTVQIPTDHYQSSRPNATQCFPVHLASRSEGRAWLWVISPPEDQRCFFALLRVLVPRALHPVR